jgi:transposase
MNKRTRRTFSAEFKLEAASLVIEQGYSIRQASEAMNVGKSTMDNAIRYITRTSCLRQTVLVI